MEWQPIETAPMDGSWILGFVSNANLPAVIGWVNTEWVGWSPIAASEIDSSVWMITHWMPLPDPPQL